MGLYRVRFPNSIGRDPGLVWNACAAIVGFDSPPIHQFLDMLTDVGNVAQVVSVLERKSNVKVRILGYPPNMGL